MKKEETTEKNLSLPLHTMNRSNRKKWLTMNNYRNWHYQESNSIKKTLGLGSSTTVKDYFDYLENSYLLFVINKFSPSVKKQIYSNKKAYLIDTGMAINIGFRTSSDLGRLLENLVFIELKRRDLEIYYFKDKYECDFIVNV